MATPNYNVNYDDKRFTEVENDKNAALSDIEETYGGMISETEGYYNDQIDAVRDYKDEQIKVQNQQTDFAIQQIERERENARKDYLKEQSGAYVDWQQQSNQFGVNAEQRAAMGMGGTGFAESSQVRMFTAYQNRVAVAREIQSRADAEFMARITEARIKNSAVLAEIAFEALQKELELSLAGFQAKNALVLEMADKKRQTDNEYHDRWQDVLNQINEENALAEKVRQFDATMAQQQAELAEQKRQFDILHPVVELTTNDIPGDNPGNKPRGTTPKRRTSKGDNDEKSKIKGKNTNKVSSNTKSAYQYLNALIKSGANKDKVSNEIAIALRDGAITKAEAANLRSIFTPRGVQYN
jgi:hypothetical protein